MAKKGAVWDKFGVFLDKFGVIWDKFGIVSDYFGNKKTPKSPMLTLKTQKTQNFRI
jgi:hypothetical protein